VQFTVVVPTGKFEPDGDCKRPSRCRWP
jgi:hypothetical protein